MSFQNVLLLFLFSASAITLVASSTAADLCAGLPKDEYYVFPHEYNCSLYYECYNGEKSLLVCEDGLYFNNKTSSCDFPENSGCTNRDPNCYGVDLDYLPQPEDCESYIQCYEGESYFMKCPDGYWFDSKSKMCVTPAISDCGRTTYPPWTTPHPICFGVRPNQTVLVAKEGSCTSYWRCTGAQLTEEDCPTGLYFDEARQLCDFPEHVICGGSTITPPSTIYPPTTPEDNDPRCSDFATSYWPHPAFCSKYIECYRGLSYEMDCPPGLYFSDSHKKCVDPRDSECGKSTGSTSEHTTVTFPTDWTPDPDCPYPQSEGKLLPFPGVCHKFYECAQGKKVEMVCPEDLWYNPAIFQCDYPYQTRCPWGRLSMLDYLYYYIFK